MLQKTILAISFFALTACTTGAGLAPVISKEPYRVIPSQAKVLEGDSIYSIAWRYGLDYQKIAEWNRIAKPYQLKVGQTLRLKSSGGSAKVTSTSTPSPKPAKSTSTPTSTPTPTPTPTPPSSPGKWKWPATGKVIAKFSRGKGQNGIKIAGKSGSAILSTAAGEVVYVGEGLRGYGKLIIVKHSTAYLSAYAHNRKILATEGASIKAGQKIAEMGDSDADRTMLHFEIRKDGQPVDPLQFLQ